MLFRSPADRQAIAELLAGGGAGSPAAELVTTAHAILRRRQEIAHGASGRWEEPAARTRVG